VLVQQDAGAGDVTVICGGVIPPDDYAMLYKAGVKAIFGPGTKVTLLSTTTRLLLPTHASTSVSVSELPTLLRSER
jgi:methylmalonyl-CoA mutase cobalamin-binding domain/chain